MKVTGWLPVKTTCLQFFHKSDIFRMLVLKGWRYVAVVGGLTGLIFAAIYPTIIDPYFHPEKWRKWLLFPQFNFGFIYFNEQDEWILFIWFFFCVLKTNLVSSYFLSHNKTLLIRFSFIKCAWNSATGFELAFKYLSLKVRWSTSDLVVKKKKKKKAVKTKRLMFFVIGLQNN